MHALVSTASVSVQEGARAGLMFAGMRDDARPVLRGTRVPRTYSRSQFETPLFRDAGPTPVPRLLVKEALLGANRVV